MSALDLKISIRQLLDKTDDPEVLTIIYALLHKLMPEGQSKGTDIIGYETDGTPISEAALIQSVLASKTEVNAENYIKHADMKAMLGL